MLSGYYRKSDDRNSLRHRISLQTHNNLQRIHPGHVVIEKDQMGEDRLHYRQPLFAVRDEQNCMAAFSSIFSIS
jgi:hypothetical protein